MLGYTDDLIRKYATCIPASVNELQTYYYCVHDYMLCCN